MNGTPPSLPNDTEDVVWALQTAESLWKRGERVDAVVWVRRAAQAAGEGDDARRAAALARYAADLSDFLGKQAAPKPAARKGAIPRPIGPLSLEAMDASLGLGPPRPKAPAPVQAKAPAPAPVSEKSETFILTANDVEFVSSSDFEAGLRARSQVPQSAAASEPPPEGAGDDARDGDVMTVSSQAPDVLLLEDEEEQDTDVTEIESLPEDENTPVVRHVKSPPPPAQTPTAAQAHAGMLDPWNDVTQAKARPRSPTLPGLDGEDEEVITSAGQPSRTAAQPPPAAVAAASVPAPPRAPNFPSPRGREVVDPPPTVQLGDDEEEETTSYRQINPRLPGRSNEPPAQGLSKAPASPSFQPKAAPPPDPRPRAPSYEPRPKTAAAPPRPAPGAPSARAPSPTAAPPRPAPPTARPPTAPPFEPRRSIGQPLISAKPEPLPPQPKSDPPMLDLLEMVDAVVDSIPSPEPLPQPPIVPVTSPEPSIAPVTSHEPSLDSFATPEPPAADRPFFTPVPSAGSALSAAPTPMPPKASQMPASARPTAPPPTAPPPDSLFPVGDLPSGIPTRPRFGPTLLDLESIEALGDLPDDAREAFGLAATMHNISIEEEVSHFALALVVEGDIDVSATIVDAPALRLTRNDVLRSRGSLVPGIALRLVCNSQKALLATWDDAAVAEAFRTCPWVEDDLRAVTDRVQAKAGITMGPLGERFDMALREHFLSKLTLRTLSPNEVLVEQGKPVGVLIVGIGDIAFTNKAGERTGSAGPGDFVFPTQTLSHASAPTTATAGPAGAVVMYGDRMTAQELLMTFPPLLEVLATL